jgi:succinyl-CoA synthetase beta subunit
MKIHEYQAKELFATYGIPVDRSIVCRSVEAAVKAYSQLDSQKSNCKGASTYRCRESWWRKAGNGEVNCASMLRIPGIGIKDSCRPYLVGQAINIEKEYYVSYVVD